MSLIKTRSHQLFPVLDANQIETARRFASGAARAFAPGEVVFDVGQRDVPMWLVLKGSLHVVRRDGLRHEAPIVTHNAGQFSGEISQRMHPGCSRCGHGASQLEVTAINSNRTDLKSAGTKIATLLLRTIESQSLPDFSR